MKKRIYNVFFLFLMMITYIYLNQRYQLYIPCLFHKITGLYCPGCGATRCIISLLKGNIYDAYHFNRLFFIMFPFLSIGLIYKAYLYIFEKSDVFFKKVPKWIWSFTLMITIIFGILRNISEFKYLGP